MARAQSERALVPGLRPSGGPRAWSRFLNASAQSTAFILNGEMALGAQAQTRDTPGGGACGGGGQR